MGGRQPVRPVWVSRGQIPDMFGLDPRTVDRALADGALIVRRFVGRKPVYRVDSIDAWLAGLDEDRPAPGQATT
ncbi:MAG: hypothetical protein E7Z96_02520 [Actinomycetaceae bacterium]|nr:hypothetical protein [Actinomycetaceae bacterium]